MAVRNVSSSSQPAVIVVDACRCLCSHTSRMCQDVCICHNMSIPAHLPCFIPSLVSLDRSCPSYGNAASSTIGCRGFRTPEHSPISPDTSNCPSSFPSCSHCLRVAALLLAASSSRSDATACMLAVPSTPAWRMPALSPRLTYVSGVTLLCKRKPFLLGLLLHMTSIHDLISRTTN